MLFGITVNNIFIIIIITWVCTLFHIHQCHRCTCTYDDTLQSNMCTITSNTWYYMFITILDVTHCYRRPVRLRSILCQSHLRFVLVFRFHAGTESNCNTTIYTQWHWQQQKQCYKQYRNNGVRDGARTLNRIKKKEKKHHAHRSVWCVMCSIFSHCLKHRPIIKLTTRLTVEQETSTYTQIYYV